MYLSHTVSSFLGKRDVDFDTISHRHTRTTNQTALSARVARSKIAKGVLYRDDEDFVLAIVPASCRVDEQALSELLGRRELHLASEDELAFVFPDCELGAIPPLGHAYGVDAVVDAALFAEDEVYFEGGDHEHLVRVTGYDFRRLMAGVPRATIGEYDGFVIMA